MVAGRILVVMKVAPAMVVEENSPGLAELTGTEMAPGDLRGAQEPPAERKRKSVAPLDYLGSEEPSEAGRQYPASAGKEAPAA